MKNILIILAFMLCMNYSIYSQWGGSQFRVPAKTSSTPVVYKTTKSTPTPTPKSQWGGASTTTQPMPKFSETDRKAILQTKQQGKVYKTRDEAVNDLKQKNKYNNYYTVQPSQRPADIPEVIVVNNVRKPIVFYNHQYGTYDDRNVFVPYNHWNDDAFIANELRRQGHVYNPPADRNISLGWFGKSLILVFVVFALGVVLILIRKVLA